MKKMIIAACAITIGVVANAATVKWAVTNVQSSPDVAVAAGWAVQIYTSATTYDYAKAATGDITATFEGSTVAAGANFRANGTVPDGQANGTTVSYYMVIYDNASIADAKNYIVSAQKEAIATAAGSDITLSFGSMSSAASSNMFVSSFWTSTAVPEPTSGLLMLLGMAGLALRRRRA